MSSGRSTHWAWQAGVEQELGFWRAYLHTRGADWPDDFRLRFDPNAPLQPHVAERLPQSVPSSQVEILDCAAGPATTLGKTLHGVRLHIVAVDALTEQYRDLLRECGLTPPVPSIACEVERLDTMFDADRFDLVYMRFALDHCYDPITALHQMVRVVRSGGVVMVEHYRDEHEDRYQGLKQWTLVPQGGDLVIKNAEHRLSVTDELAQVEIEVVSNPSWLTVILHKA